MDDSTHKAKEKEKRNIASALQVGDVVSLGICICVHLFLSTNFMSYIFVKTHNPSKRRTQSGEKIEKKNGRKKSHRQQVQISSDVQANKQRKPHFIGGSPDVFTNFDQVCLF